MKKSKNNVSLEIIGKNRDITIKQTDIMENKYVYLYTFKSLKNKGFEENIKKERRHI